MPPQVCSVVPFIIYNITTIETIVSDCITLFAFKYRAQKFLLMMATVTPKHVREIQ